MSRKRLDVAGNDLGAIIRAAREARRWNHAELAGRVGYSRQRIGSIERAKVRPNIGSDLAQKLSEVLEIPIELLLPRRPSLQELLPDIDITQLTEELRKFVDLAVKLEATPSDLSVAQDMLQSLHRQRQTAQAQGEAPQSALAPETQRPR